MSNNLLWREVQLGYAGETTVGTRAANIVSGVPNLNKASIVHGQEIIQEQKGTGLTVPSDVEHKAGVKNPTLSLETTLFAPLFGQIAASLCLGVVETGAGPYIQTILPSASAGKAIANGESSNLAMSFVELLGVSGSDNLAGLGGLCAQLDLTIPETGLCKISPKIMFFGYDDADDGSAGTGSFDLPDPALELLAHDLKFALDGAALYSDEISLSIFCDYVVKRYGGQNDALPYKMVANGFRIEGSFSKPVVDGTDTLNQDYIHDGGEAALGGDYYNNVSLVIHPASLAYGATLDTAGQIRIAANIILDEAVPGGDDELKEQVSFHGSTNQSSDAMLSISQATAAAQSWAA